jgi:hypothetical protein
MRIDGLETLRRDGRSRIQARIAFEERERELALWFETEAPFDADLAPSPEAFVTACLPMAKWYGERRIRVEGRVCPLLRDGLLTASELLGAWFPRRSQPLALEPSGGFAPTLPRSPERSALFFSGGVDGFALLRWHGREYAPGAPGAACDALHLFGLNNFDFEGDAPAPDRLAAWEARRRPLAAVAEAQGLALVPVWTNVRRLCPDHRAWTAVGFGCMTAAVAHALARRLDVAVLASDGGRGEPAARLGGHPLLAPSLSSAAVQLRDGLGHLDRGERLRLLSDWEDARRLAQPCHCIELPAEGRVNCGRCEKCVRTMLLLAALGRLRDWPAFGGEDVTPESVAAIPLEHAGKRRLLAACLPDLARGGRGDLVRAVEARLAAARAPRPPRRRWKRWLGLGGPSDVVA